MTRTLTALAIVASLSAWSGAPPAAADEAAACMSRREQRLAIADGRAVTLAAAMRSARVSVRGRSGH